jgi:gliding motility-associated-like protein
MPTCEGYKDGVISLSGFGGTKPYTYSTDNINFNNTVGFANLPEGSYTFYIKDANACLNDTTIKLTGYPHILYNNVDVKDPSCFGFKDGMITLNMAGGVPPFTYQLTGGATQTDNHFDSLKQGTYAIRIKDSKGCYKDTTIMLLQPDKLVLKTTVIPNDCEGLDDGGGVEVTVTGGTQPYSYLWTTNPPNTASGIHGISNGKYLVYVHDDHSCQDSALALVAYDNCCKPFIPDAFTPNGDGRNDVYRVMFKGDMKLIGFSIFNRFGQRVFYTTDTKASWDGTFNGIKQDMGTYMYYIKAICGNKGDNVVEFKGDVTLIR